MTRGVKKMTESETASPATAPRGRGTRGLSVYIAIAFLGAWAVWVVCIVLQHHGVPGKELVPALFVSSFAPFLGCGLAVWSDGDVRAVLRFYGRGLRWRMGWPVLGISVLFTPLLGVAVVAIASALAGKPMSFLMDWRAVPYSYVFLLILGGALAEEFGWSYLSDRLDERLAPVSSNLVLGVIWSLWHLPLFFLIVPGATQSFIPFPVFLLTCVCYRFLMSWCYHRGGRSILSNLLAHNGFNFAISLVPIVLPIYGTVQWRLVALGLLTGLTAAVLYRLLPPTSQPLAVHREIRTVSQVLEP